ncbi:MAG: hypothetical protein IIB38_14535, partial [Candidatus Hydrogenedentes bacterium]|nr:hypothetical protein [Candidatus Hydrogenedentota bacterium]
MGRRETPTSSGVVAANRGGRTVFLEHSDRWIKTARDAQPDLEIVRVEYHTTLSQWSELLSGPEEHLAMKFPAWLESMCWGTVIVDSPEGHSEGCPGRMQ